MQQRNFPIDVLRTIGILAIMLAHMPPPFFIQQVRSFDVPLMVILSGFVFRYRSASVPRRFDAKAYIKKRFVRLIVPVWIFFSFFFVLVYAGSLITTIEFPFTMQQILETYVLWNGIGFVWILRIFFLIALFGPLWLRIMEKISHKFITLVLLFVGYQLFFPFYTEHLMIHINLRQFLNGTLFFLIPYLLFFTFGFYFKNLSYKQAWGIIGVSAALLVAEYVSRSLGSEPLLNLQAYKYPPQQFYVYYAVGISTFLLNHLRYIDLLRQHLVRRVIHFVGSSTLWIYFWHIPITLFLHEMGFDRIGLKYVIVVAGALFVTWMQQRCIYFFIKKYQWCNRRGVLIRRILVG